MAGVTERLRQAIDACVRPATFPVAVRMAAPGEEMEQKHRKPARDLDGPIAVCQGMTIARTYGWTLAFGPEDHGCPLAAIATGHLAPDRFLAGEVADLYQDDPAASAAMESTYPLNPAGSVGQVWLSPVARCAFEPDLVAVYGNPAQILVLIHAANYGLGTGIGSASTGRFGCSAWLAGVSRSGECAYAVPGSGERVFGGAQDSEMVFFIPRRRFGSVAEGLEAMRKKGTYRYPVPDLNLLSTPRLPERYRVLEEGKDKQRR